MTAALATLNPAAQVALVSCEQRIERGLKTFIDVGQALAEIRDSRLYKGTHDTFEAYCRDRWKMTDGRARQLMIAAATATNVAVTGLPTPVNEGQARALAAVPEPERAEVWREATERTGGKPTAKVVTEIARERTETPGPVEPLSTASTGPGPSPAPAAAAPGPSQEPAGDPERHLHVVPTPEQVEAARMEEQRVQLVDRARRKAPRLVHEVRYLINEVMAGMNLGEADLVTPQTIADLRELVDILEARMEATQ